MIQSAPTVTAARRASRAARPHVDVVPPVVAAGLPAATPLYLLALVLIISPSGAG